VNKIETMNLKAFILSLIYARIHSFKEEYAGSLLGINLKSSSNLTITSILYNPTIQKSSWIDSIFGSRAFFYDFKKNEQAYDKRSLSMEEKSNHTKNFQKHFKLPEYALKSACSLELLGFAKIFKQGLFHPNDKKKLLIGDASIVIEDRSIDWRCFYRPLFENWRRETVLTEPNFWSLFMFCPAPNQSACDKLNKSLLKMKELKKDLLTNKNLDQGYVSLKTQSINNWSWKAAFKFSFFPRKKFLARDLADGEKIKGLKKLNAAVCLSIPYTSSFPFKAAANGAMLLEWIRYYTTLGFKVLIYDRDGANEKHIFKSDYGSAQNITIPKDSLVYHPYTIRGLLHPLGKGITFDNSEGPHVKEFTSYRGRHESQGHDKVLSLTHCRFEAASLYGIEDVLIVDFDEFLYCPEANATAEAQGEYLYNLFVESKKQGVEQIEINQRMIGNKTDSPRDCLVERSSKGLSIYDCFSSYRFYNGAHSIKSMHLSHICPLTGFHQACPSEISPKTHNCECKSLLMRCNNRRPYTYWKGRECGIIHLSTNARDYGKKGYIFNQEQVRGLMQSKLELGMVVNSI
jgi:hypothetical protein